MPALYKGRGHIAAHAACALLAPTSGMGSCPKPLILLLGLLLVWAPDALPALLLLSGVAACFFPPAICTRAVVVVPPSSLLLAGAHVDVGMGGHAGAEGRQEVALLPRQGKVAACLGAYEQECVRVCVLCVRGSCFLPNI